MREHTWASASSGERERQQVVEVQARDAAPAEMLGHERGLDARDQPRKLVEMRAGERVGRPERQADAVQREGIVGAYPVEGGERGAAVGEIVLAVDLEPRH